MLRNLETGNPQKSSRQGFLFTVGWTASCNYEHKGVKVRKLLKCTDGNWILKAIFERLINSIYQNMTPQQHHAPGAESLAFTCFAPHEKSSIGSRVPPNCGTQGTFTASNILTAGQKIGFGTVLLHALASIGKNPSEQAGGKHSACVQQSRIAAPGLQERQLLLAGFCFLSAIQREAFCSGL